MHEIRVENFEFAAIVQHLDQVIKPNASENSVIHLEVVEQSRPDTKGVFDSLVGFSMMEGAGCVRPFSISAAVAAKLAKTILLSKTMELTFSPTGPATSLLNRFTLGLNTWEKTGGFQSSGFEALDSA